MLALVVPDGAFLTWDLPVYGPPPCPTPYKLYFHEAYLGPGTGLAYYYNGVRLLNPSETSLHLSPGKPEVGCAILWEGSEGDGVASPYWPRAINSQFQTLPPECQPYNHRADSQSWEGM